MVSPIYFKKGFLQKGFVFKELQKKNFLKGTPSIEQCFGATGPASQGCMQY